MSRSRLIGESIYCVFVRNHSVSGDFNGLILDLERIKGLGVSSIWILPHYPIGQVHKKGQMGSPYSIKDYYGVNPDYGGLNDFKRLVKECHNIGLELIIDIVFNHTSCDSELLLEHPTWFTKSTTGDIEGKVPQWSDVYDLDFNHRDLWEYLFDVLKYWADLGVDGFRCDVASIIPLEFWKVAKERISEAYPYLIWIAESVEKEFVSFIRHKGYVCHSDSELYSVFDILYDYDVQYSLEGYILGKNTFDKFIYERRNQEVVYPSDYLKLRFLENHDSKERAATLIEDKYSLRNWKAFSIFEKGIPLIFAGEEVMIKEKINLVDDSVVNWENGDNDFTEYIKKLLQLEHLEIVLNGIYTINPLAEGCAHIRYRYLGETLHGIFNFGNMNRVIDVEVLNGSFKNLINNEDFDIISEKLDLEGAPFIFKSIP